MRSVMLWVFIGCAALCGCEQRGFECGSPLPSDPDVIRRCDRANEICVCATRSCAAPVIASDDAHLSCASGYRYVETPFAHPDHADECVPVALIGKYDLLNQAAFLTADERGLTCEPYDAAIRDNDSGSDDSGSNDNDAEVGR